MAGLGTAPPNTPECRSRSGPWKSTVQLTRPRMPVTVLGTSSAIMPVSVMTTTSQSSRSRRSASSVLEVRRARLLLALDEELERDAGRPAGRGEVRAQAEQVEQQLPLVVGGAASPQHVAVDGRVEGIGVPELHRVDGLHVVVAVDEHDGRVRIVARPLGEDAGSPAVGQISTVGKPVRRAASANHSALRATSPWCSGWALMPGMRSHWSRSSSNSPRWSSMNSLTVGMGMTLPMALVTVRVGLDPSTRTSCWPGDARFTSDDHGLDSSPAIRRRSPSASSKSTGATVSPLRT